MAIPLDMQLPKRRIQFEFSDGAVDELDALATALGARSRAEVVRRALTLIRFYADLTHTGGRLVAHRADGTTRRIVLA